MLDEENPTFPNWDQDVTAIEDHYADQDPLVVVHDLDAAAQRVADRLDAVHGEQWARPGLRSDGAQFTVESFARYLVHDHSRRRHSSAGGGDLRAGTLLARTTHPDQPEL